LIFKVRFLIYINIYSLVLVIFAFLNNKNKSMHKSKNYVNRFNKKEKNTTFTVKEKSTLFDFIRLKMPEKSRNAVKELLSNKQVRINKNIETNFNFPLLPDDKITISSLKAPKEIPLKNLKIIFEDSQIIVINKDKGLLSVSTEKENEKTAFRILSNYLKQADPKNQLFVVHRLDRETSGIMLFAKNMEVKKYLQSDWKTNVMDRCYYVVVEGEVKSNIGTIHSWLAENKNYQVYSTDNPNIGQEAETHYKVINRNKDYSLLEVRLSTGRKNQIRVHMKDLGHSVIGDKKYGATQPSPINRLGLHAFLLSFKHPTNGEKMKFDTPIPTEFNKLFKKSDIIKY